MKKIWNTPSVAKLTISQTKVPAKNTNGTETAAANTKHYITIQS